MRKTAEITISREGRDKDKVFLITEMDSFRAESWGVRAMGAMSRGGVPIPDEIMEAGLAAVAMYGLKALMSGPWSEIEPLLEEMMGCVQRVEPLATRALVESDVEELATVITLRDEVFKLHTGFSIAAALLGAVASAQKPKTAAQGTS